jgi:alpha-tubulin suppressor-like RCC1 family protein
MIASALALLLGLLAAGCNGELVGGGQIPARLLVVSGDMQVAPVGTELPQPLVVRVVDENNRPVKNQLVNFVVTAGGGSVFAGSALTNAQGEARERWRLGPSAADSQRVEARAVDPSTGTPLVFAVFKATALAGPATGLVAVGASARQGFAATVLADSLAVRLVDANGNPVAGAPVTWSVVRGGGSISPPTSTTNAQGIARAAWTLGASADSANEARATSGAFTVQFTATAQVGAPATVTVDPAQLTFTVGGAARTVTATVRDAGGNVVAGAAVTWASTDPSVVQVAGNGNTATVTPAGTGSAQVRATAGSATGAAAVTVSGLAFASSGVEAGGDNACSLTTAGDLYCWGRYHSGTPDTRQLTPRQVETSLQFVQLETQGTYGQGRTCAITADGRGYCWGAGALGAGSNSSGPVTSYAVPIPVAGNHTFRSIHTGEVFGCGLTTAGAAWCWGSPRDGNLGSTDPAPYAFSPVPVSGGHVFASMALGDRHSCGVKANGEVWCWGRNGARQLGAPSANACPVQDGSSPPLADCARAPVQLAGGISFSKATAGTEFTCALTGAGAAYCWGRNNVGQVGSATTETCVVQQVSGSNGTPEIRVPCAPIPARVAGAPAFTALTAGDAFACGLTAAGQVYCWGQAAGIVNSPTAVAVGGASRFTAISAGSQLCGRATDARVYCWGPNDQGQLGDGTTTPRTSPTRVANQF